jgi:hypothetical protein
MAVPDLPRLEWRVHGLSTPLVRISTVSFLSSPPWRVGVSVVGRFGRVNTHVSAPDPATSGALRDDSVAGLGAKIWASSLVSATDAMV